MLPPKRKKRTIYKNSVLKLVKFLRHHGWNHTGLALGTILLEPLQALRATLHWPLNWKKLFDFHNLNPTVITPEQAKQQPILLLHGNYHNQSAWISFAKKLKKANIGPVYTVNFPHGAITDIDHSIINEAVERIKEQYAQHGVHDVKIHLVGHSRGGMLAHMTGLSHLKQSLGKIIKIGFVINQKELEQMHEESPHLKNHLYEITGQHDIIISDPSLLPSQQKIEISVGHLRLVYSKDVHHQIIHWLKSP